MKYYESFREQTNGHTVEGVLDYFNKRIRVDHYTGNIERIIQTIDELAEKHSFTKCIVKGKESMFQHGSLSVFIRSNNTTLFSRSRCILLREI